MRFVSAALLAAMIGVTAAAGTAQTPPAPASTAGADARAPKLPPPHPAPEDPKVTKLAIGQFLAWQSGTIDRSRYGAAVNANLTDKVLQGGSAALARLGGLQKATFLGISVARGARFYVYRMACENGSIRMEFSLAPDGRIALIFFE